MERVENPSVGESAGGESGDACAGRRGVGDQRDELIIGIAERLVGVEQDGVDIGVGD